MVFGGEQNEYKATRPIEKFGVENSHQPRTLNLTLPETNRPQEEDIKMVVFGIEDGKESMEEFDEEIVEDDESYDEEEVVEGEEEEEIFEEVVEDEEEGEGGDETPLAGDSVALQSEVALDSVASTADLPSIMNDVEAGAFAPGGPPTVVEQPQRTGMQFEIPQKPAKSQISPRPFVDEVDAKPRNSSPLCYWLVCFFICGLLGAGGYFGWYLVNEDQSDDPNLRESGTRAPTPAPTVAFVTAFDPVQGNCQLKSLSNPHPIDQCRCNGKIRNLAEDVVDRYQFHLDTFIPTVFLEYTEEPGSCTARNQALTWLSSGNDFAFSEEERTERFALATIYAELIGSDWVSQDNWLSEDSICTWTGVTCDDQGLLQVLSLPANELVGRVSTVDVLWDDLRTRAFTHLFASLCSYHLKLHC